MDRKAKAAHRLRTPWQRSISVLLPQDCAACDGHTTGDLLCEACHQELPRLGATCPGCALPMPEPIHCGTCLKSKPAFDATLAVWHYAHPVDRLLQMYKYGGLLALSELFAQELAGRLGDQRDIDLIVPMPLHVERLRHRGFNQAHEIAKRLGAGIPVDPFAASRVRDTAVQADLPIGARSKNVRNAFAATAHVMGRRIAVVDDVMTTGATLNALARTLKAHGALHVENWVVARALLDA